MSDQDTALLGDRARTAGVAGGLISETDRAVSKIAASTLARLTGESQRFVARAPGRLDVMGRASDYTGALVVNTTSAHQVCVAVQRRTDRMISVETVGAPADGGASKIALPLSRLSTATDATVESDGAAELLEDKHGDAVRCVVGALVELLREEIATDYGDGLSIAVGSTMDDLQDLGQTAATASATIVAVARAMDVSIDHQKAAVACRRVENRWLGVPTGGADALCSLTGEPHALLQIRCDPLNLSSSILLPDDLMIVGLDSGVTRAGAADRRRKVRVATMMGRLLIGRIIEFEGGDRSKWDGTLAHISVSDYVRRFRDRLPTGLKGRDFLERFGETGDPLTRIDPDLVYKIRSRCEHHVYENARAHEFVEGLSRAIRSGNRDVLVSIGELMYSSHWSYGQRCGLGCVETDLLVSLLRRHGVGADVFGAKLSGRGCGGVVTALIRPSEKAWAALDDVVREYGSHTDRSATIVWGSSPGALVSGAQSV